MQKRERIMTESRKTERLLASFEAEEKGLREELERLEKDVVGEIRKAMAEGKEADTNRFKKRRAEISDELDILEKKRAIARETLTDLESQFREVEHKRLVRERERLTMERVKAGQEAKQRKQEWEQSERRWLDLSAQIQAVVSRIHEFEHGPDHLKAPSFVRKPMTDEERSEREWKNASNEHYREWDNQLLRALEMYEPNSNARESEVRRVLAVERGERDRMSLNLVRKIERQSERPDFLAGMSVKEICALPYPEAVRLRDESMGRETTPPSKEQPKTPLEPGAPGLPPG